MNAPIPTPHLVREITLANLGPCGDLVVKLVAAYDGLPTHLAGALASQFDGDLGPAETHALAGRLLDEVPMDQMQLILTRLLCMAEERPMHGGFVDDTPVDIDLTLPAGLVGEQDC